MYHTIIIVGNLGKDPEMRYTPSGQAVTSFSVATSRQYTGQNGQKVKETIWFRVSAWGKQAETCNQYLRKGSKVLVEGRLTPDPSTGATFASCPPALRVKVKAAVAANSPKGMLATRSRSKDRLP